MRVDVTIDVEHLEPIHALRHKVNSVPIMVRDSVCPAKTLKCGGFTGKRIGTTSEYAGVLVLDRAPRGQEHTDKDQVLDSFAAICACAEFITEAPAEAVARDQPGATDAESVVPEAAKPIPPVQLFSGDDTEATVGGDGDEKREDGAE